MITSKHINIIVAVLTALAVVLSIGLVAFASMEQSESDSVRTADYETELFDTTKPVEINIIMDDDKWKDILQNAAEKKWQKCDVIVNGTRFYNVGFRTKGANSLEEIVNNPDSNRYSFKIEFDKYNEGQKCFGLDKLCLNNNFGDPSNMKEAMVYDMFRFMDAEAPLYNYARISVNGEYWGQYLALEAVEDSFLARNYGNERGNLYKPGSSSEKGSGSEMDEWAEEDMESWSDEAQAEEDYGGSLNYSSDNISDYQVIFDGAKNKTSDADKKRVIKALKNINQKTDIESYMVIDNVLKYMAVQNFSVNFDSLLGDGGQNYYLYESEGKLSLIPWDYNLCFGAYEPDKLLASNPEGLSATEIINKSIDDSWLSTTFFDGLLENEEYRNRYHEYYRKLIDEYVLGNGFESFYKRTRNLTDSYVKTDPNALYDYQEYDDAAKMLRQMVLLRGQSVNGQLNGSIPSTLSEQNEHKEALIDGSSINLNLLNGSDGAEGMEGEWNEEDWQKQFAEYVANMKAEMNRKNLKSGVVLGVSLLSMLVATGVLFGMKRYRVM